MEKYQKALTVLASEEMLCASRMHTHTRTHTRTHARTHAHTHTPSTFPASSSGEEGRTACGAREHSFALCW